MTLRDLPMNMDKCVRHVGGTKVFFYACKGGSYTLVDPVNGDIFPGYPESHFKKCYLPYSVNLPEAVRSEMEAVPSFRDWRKMRENSHA